MHDFPSTPLLLPLTLSTLAAFSSPAAAQNADGADAPGRGQRPSPSLAMDSWRVSHGQSWRSASNSVTGKLEMLYGGSAEAPFRPQVDEDWFTLARTFVAEAQGLQPVHGGTLVDDAVKFLPLGQVNTTDKMAVKLRQEIGGVPVVNGYVNALFSMDGDLLAIQNTALELPPNTNTTPAISADAAARSARDIFRRAQTVAPAEIGEAELRFAQIDGSPLLVWRVDVHGEDARIAFKYVFDAQTGQLVDTEDLVHHFDVGGTVSTNATPGTQPDTTNNPETVQPLPLARVSSSAGTVFTDGNGNFNFPGVNSPLQVTIEYVGQFYDIRNSAGAEHQVTTTAAVGNGNNLLLNPSSIDSITGAANAYIGSHETRGLIKSVDPSDNTGDFNIISNVNLNSTCNAFFNGSSINFYPAGGGCVNTSYSTVVAHELGHWLNVRYGTGNGSDGMGEGNADMFAMYTYDAPIVGRHFAGQGNHIRTGNNTRQWCGSGCYGQVHTDGEVWMGAGWKIRRNLKQTHGAAVGGMIANTLFMGWMNGFNQTQISPTIETQWLTLDDDDGNLDNGTPNYSDIDGAFREQGFPGVDLQFFLFNSLSQVPNTENDLVANTVAASVDSNFGNTVTGVTLRYRVNRGALQSVVMANAGGSSWEGDIPAIPAPAVIDYYITATDDDSNSSDFPGGAETLNFKVGVLTPMLVTDFEATGNEGWTGGAPGDDATTGIWTRVNPNGTEAQPEDDHTASGVRAWVTGQGAVGGGLGDNDVDGGTTTLLSPVFDGTGGSTLPLSYWRWYSNQTGASPNADVFRVEVSNNGGSSWTTIETVGPGGAQSNGGWFRHQSDLLDTISATANMQLRFVASDLGDGSIVEAAVDDIDLVGLEDGTVCLPPTNYCVAAAHSESGGGAGAVVSMNGSQVVTDNDFTLEVADAPSNKFGVFFYGPSQIQVTFGDGFRCVGGATQRLPLVQTDGTGFAEYPVDLPSQPNISAGSTQNFQFWFRDPMGPGGNGFNTSNGLSVPFCP